MTACQPPSPHICFWAGACCCDCDPQLHPGRWAMDMYVCMPEAHAVEQCMAVEPRMQQGFTWRLPPVSCKRGRRVH